MSLQDGESKTLTAFFDTRRHAEKAVDRLIAADVAQSAVRLMPGYESDRPEIEPTRIRQGFFEALANVFMPDEDRHGYAEGLSRGGFLISVSGLSQTETSKVMDILDDEGAVDFDAREDGWRSEG